LTTRVREAKKKDEASGVKRLGSLDFLKEGLRGSQSTVKGQKDPNIESRNKRKARTFETVRIGGKTTT